MNKPRVIAVVYSGNEPSEACLSSFVRAMITTNALQDVKDVDVFVMDPKEIATCVQTKIVKPTVKISEPEFVVQEKTPEEHSLIYIGTLLESNKQSMQYDAFGAMNFITKRCKDDPKMRNAVRILAKGDPKNISPDLRRKYKFNPVFRSVVSSINQLL